MSPLLSRIRFVAHRSLFEIRRCRALEINRKSGSCTGGESTLGRGAAISMYSITRQHNARFASFQSSHANTHTHTHRHMERGSSGLRANFKEFESQLPRAKKPAAAAAAAFSSFSLSLSLSLAGGRERAKKAGARNGLK